MTALLTGSGGVYGSPRVHAMLKREGVHVGRKRVERLMREADLAGLSPRRGGFTRRDPEATLAPDLVNRDFTAQGPNRLWVTDLTMIATGEGPLRLSAIRDAFSRRVVAWETSARADADLVLSSLEYASASREVEPGKLVHHADHGSQYTSIKLTTRLQRAGIEALMGSVGVVPGFVVALSAISWPLLFDFLRPAPGGGSESTPTHHPVVGLDPDRGAGPHRLSSGRREEGECCSGGGSRVT